jgi:hypothetical protein
MELALGISLALVAALALGCATPHAKAEAPTSSAPPPPGTDWRVAGKIDFEVYNAPICGGAGPSPSSQCSRAHYTGSIQALGETAVQRFAPMDDVSGLVFITENEVIHFPDGDLKTRVNAVFHAKSSDAEFVSMHTVVGGTGRYEGATGHLQLKGHGAKDTDYEGVIRLAR